MFKRVLLILAGLIVSIGGIQSQTYCPDLGPDQNLPCGQTQATLTANLSNCSSSSVTANQTTTYNVTNIPFAPQPTVGATTVNMSDDSGAGPFNIGFTFCFFGNSYTQFYIGSNGWISFSPGQSVGFIPSGIPNTGNVPKNCIMGPWQDWHPGIPGGPYISYKTIGTAPCRKLIVTWSNCPMYSCTTTKGTFQIIIYEATNYIENHITQKLNCANWYPIGVEGIHNLGGTIGITVPGRNSSTWTANNDAYRYTPSGAVITPTLTWYQVGNPIAIGTGSTIVVTPGPNGDKYTCTYSYGGCNTGFEICNSSASNVQDTVEVVPSSIINPTITAPTCIGSPTQISVSPNSATNTILWAGPGIVGPNNTPTITINAAGSYSCFITSTVSSCTGSAVVNIAQSPTVTISASSNTMCGYSTNGSPNTVSLTATGATNYTWSSISGMNNNSSSSTSNTIALSSIGGSPIGTITVEGSNGTCSGFSTFTVIIVPNPTISVNSGSVCQFNTLALTASNATTYTWSPSTDLNTSTGANVVTSSTISTVYSVIGTSLGCNSSTELSNVTVVPNPTVMIAPLVNTVCAGDNISLSATGATNYTWTPSSSLNFPNGPSVTASPSVTTNYTIIGEQATCTTTAVYQVSVIGVPNIIAAAANPTICQYSSTNINANGATSYSWSPSAGLNTSIGNFVVANPNVTTVYNIVGNNGECLAYGTVTIFVTPFPNLNLSTPNNRICETESTTIFASGADFYKWQPTSGLSSTNSPMVIANPSGNINYTVTGYNIAYGITCSYNKEIEIEVIKNITPTISAGKTICEGETVRLSAGGSVTYSWMPANSLSDPTAYNPVAQPNETTTYTCMISYFGDCTKTSTVTINVNPTPTVTAGEDFVANLDEQMFLNAKGTGTLTWFADDDLLCRVCPNTQILPKASKCFKIQAENEFHCFAYDEVCVEVTTNYNIFIPNIFTPNFDGINDIFLVYGTGMSDFEMYIYDRWGEKLFVSKDQLTGWDGTYKGELMKQDVYTYMIKYKGLDGKRQTKTGHVTLMK